jgi:hypothetical protein
LSEKWRLKACLMSRYYTAIALISFILQSSGCADHATRIDLMAEQVYSSSSPGGPLPPHAFKSDGCSCWPDGDWLECCVKHDLLYWAGGAREERKNADIELRNCIAEKGHPVVAQVMFLGVRIGGVWWLPTPFRWGFGWNYPASGPPGEEY